MDDLLIKSVPMVQRRSEEKIFDNLRLVKWIPSIIPRIDVQRHNHRGRNSGACVFDDVILLLGKKNCQWNGYDKNNDNED